jgi:hypothetical protein
MFQTWGLIPEGYGVIVSGLWESFTPNRSMSLSALLSGRHLLHHHGFSQAKYGANDLTIAYG